MHSSRPSDNQSSIAGDFDQSDYISEEPEAPPVCGKCGDVIEDASNRCFIHGEYICRDTCAKNRMWFDNLQITKNASSDIRLARAQHPTEYKFKMFEMYQLLKDKGGRHSKWHREIAFNLLESISMFKRVFERQQTFLLAEKAFKMFQMKEMGLTEQEAELKWSRESKPGSGVFTKEENGVLKVACPGHTVLIKDVGTEHNNSIQHQHNQGDFHRPSDFLENLVDDRTLALARRNTSALGRESRRNDRSSSRSRSRRRRRRSGSMTSSDRGGRKHR